MNRFTRILLYVGTQDVDAAIRRAVQLALENDAALTLMDVIKPLPRVPGLLTNLASAEELEQEHVAETRDKLLRLAAEYSDTGVSLDIVVQLGKPEVEIVRQVLRNQHDLVIKTADGRRRFGRLFGSTMTALLRTCPCPVWALKPEMHGEFDSVLAAIDPEPEDDQHRELNREILELALGMCRRENAVLHLVGVWDLWMEASLRVRAGDQVVDAVLVDRQADLQRRFEQLLSPHVIDSDRVELHLKRGSPAESILAVAEEVAADLMVMGTVCRTGVSGFLIGNTAEQILSAATCSVLALKPAGFISPVHLD